MSNKSERRLEKYALPESTDGICALVRKIINGGNVSRIEFDNDDTLVRAWRWVDMGDLEESTLSWDGALRNIDPRHMLEYSSPGATAFQVLVDMMLLAQKEGPHAVLWATGRGGKDLIEEWLELHDRDVPVSSIEQLQGVPLLELKSLPKDTLVLCCSKYRNAEPTEITAAIKTAIDLRNGNESFKQNVNQGGNHSQERAGAPRRLSSDPGGLRRVAWEKPGNS